MIHVSIQKNGKAFPHIIKHKIVKSSKEVYKVIRKYYNKYKYDIMYRVYIYSDDSEGIQFIINTFMPSEYSDDKTITDIGIETTLDLLPVIAEIEGENYHYYDFHKDCIDLKKDDIIYSIKDNRYFLVYHDPDEFTIGYAVRNAHDCDSNYMLSRMDVRKASEEEIKRYGLDKLRDIYKTSATEVVFNQRLSNLVKEYPRLA